MVEECGGFVLVHITTPLSVCESRDSKGLYAKARAGMLSGLTGISDPYEAPTDADISIDTSTMSPQDAALRVIGFLTSKGYLI